MTRFRIGVQFQPQHVTYADFADGVRRADELGVDTIWTWDHFYPLYGDPEGTHFEGWTLLSSMAVLTSRAEIGCLVTCNSYRNSNLLADMARTIDHISGGRLIFGIGAGWFERDYREYGYDFGTGPSRLKDLGQSLPVIKERWQKLNPAPVRHPLPIMIGGSGEKVTLKLVAQHADMWNSFGPPESYKHKNEVLTNWCHELGRDPAAIERTVLINADELDNLDAFIDAGATHFILGTSMPWNFDAIQRLVQWRDAQG